MQQSIILQVQERTERRIRKQVNHFKAIRQNADSLLFCPKFRQVYEDLQPIPKNLKQVHPDLNLLLKHLYKHHQNLNNSQKNVNKQQRKQLFRIWLAESLVVALQCLRIACNAISSIVILFNQNTLKNGIFKKATAA